MYEATGTVDMASWSARSVVKRVLQAANAAPLAQYADDEQELCFAGRLISSKLPVLVVVTAVGSGSAKVAVSVEEMVIGASILKAIRAALADK